MRHAKRGLCAVFLLVAVLLASFPHQSMAETNAIELRWNELSGIAVGKDIDIQLPDGSRVRGELLVVRDNALSVDVSKTSNSRIYPKGQRDIPRTDVSTFEMRRLKTVRWRVVGTTVGIIGGLATGGAVAAGLCDYDCGAAAGWAAIGAAVGVAILGNRLGKAADMQRTIVKIIP